MISRCKGEKKCCISWLCLLLFLPCKALFAFNTDPALCLMEEQFNPVQVLKDVSACSLLLSVEFLRCPEYGIDSWNILRAS